MGKVVAASIMFGWALCFFLMPPCQAGDCDQFRDTLHQVDACYRAEHFVANGETLDLMSHQERQKFDEWFKRKQDCLNQFCDKEKADQYPKSP